MHLDLRGLECPAPTIKTVEALKRLRGVEEVVVVVLDDAVCAADIPSQASRFGDEPCTEVTGTAEWTITLTARH